MLLLFRRNNFRLSSHGDVRFYILDPALFIVSPKMRFDQLRLRGLVIPRNEESLLWALDSSFLGMTNEASGRNDEQRLGPFGGARGML